MKQLPLIRKTGACHFKQIRRGQRSCIYEREFSPTVKYYEVFIITTRPKRILAGKILEACEAYPNNEAFGYWAWEYRSLDAAIRKFEELESRSQNEEGQ